MDAAAEAEFTLFVQQRTPALMRAAYALCGNQHDAEDLLQNALAKVAVRWSRINFEPEPYVRVAMYREFVSIWRRRRRRPEVAMESPPAGAARGDHPAETADRLAIRDVLLTLPPRQRAVLVLRFLEDMSEREVASALGCSPGTVASQASRALATLRAARSMQMRNPRQEVRR